MKHLLLALLLSGCNIPIDDSSSHTWTYSIDYLKASTNISFDTQEGTIDAGVQTLPIVGKSDVFITGEETNAKGQTYRQLFVSGNTSPTLTITCELNAGTRQTVFTIDNTLALLEIRCTF